MRLTKLAILSTTALLFAAAPAAAQQKKVIATAADLPRVQVQLPAKPSEIAINGGPQLEALETQLEAYVRDLMTNYDIQDRSTRMGLLSVLAQDALVDNRWDEYLKLADEIAALEEKPAQRAVSGLLGRSYARAAKAVGEGSPQFADRFETELRTALQALDWSLVADSIQASRGSYQTMSRDLIVGGLQGGLDTAAAAQNNKVDIGIAGALIGAHRTLTEVLPLKDRIFRVYDAQVKANQKEKADRWSERLVELTPAQAQQPVVIAIWDGGFDPSVFGSNLWRNAKEQANGRDDDGNGFVDDVHGIAFTPEWTPSTGDLRPMPAEDTSNLPSLLKLVKGSLDQQAAVDSAEAAAMRQRLSTLKPNEVLPFSLQMARVGLFLHGTATGWTSSVGNPAARLLNTRFDYEIAAVPKAMDEKIAENFADHVSRAIAYYKANGVRVVNMSWRITEPQIEAMFAAHEPDLAKRKARTKAVFDRMNGALETAFRSAPDVLFIAGAGNEDQDVDFVRSFPAGINLPNVITVGAVDVALQPAGFTSYGKSIDLYANGFEVPSKAPTGLPINISGTSLAAPQVTNLAGKLLAVNPKLTVAQLRQIIEETSTEEGPKKFKVINPKAALARAK
ncbi:S8 family serine peptidase [Sphingomonas arenae]|uniref:S8 family serine peptidase n=1 Tax=Sphingomonas arenae TaxID=2812555 RepID=UPI001968A153|nr:S8 family serine peptidase [Sphingomonas arenae]